VKSRLRRFIDARVSDRRDAEDILQDVFSELVEANRLLMPIEHVTAWLFRVARNRIIDLFRKKKPELFTDDAVGGEDEETVLLEELLPSPDAGPDAVYARNVLLKALRAALDELPAEQRAVFVAHEIDGQSFREMAAETGINVNTLLSRKRDAGAPNHVLAGDRHPRAMPDSVRRFRWPRRTRRRSQTPAPHDT
jgi:RNA polymerase sigma factor (sigma-70 family)